MEEWLTILCWISLTLATGTLITFTCNKARRARRPVPQKKPPRKRTEADESLFSKKYDQPNDGKIHGNKDPKKDSSKPNNFQPKSKASAQSAGKKSNGELELTVHDHSNPRQPNIDAPEMPQIEAPEIPQIDAPEIPQMASSSDGGDGKQQFVPAEPQKPITREEKEQQSENQITNEKKSRDNVNAKEPQPEEIPMKVVEAETGKESNNEGASSKSKKKKKKHKKREKESDGDEDSSKKKKKKKHKKKKKAKDEDDGEGDDSSGKRKSSKKHKKKKKHHKNPKEDEENDLNPQEVLPVMSPAKTKFENEPPPKARDAYENHDPGMMTQLNNVLIDGAEGEDVAIPSQLKKAIAKQDEKEANFAHLPPAAIIDKHQEPLIPPSHSKTNFESMPPLANAQTPSPSNLKKSAAKKEVEVAPSPVAEKKLTDFETNVRSPLITPSSKHQQPAVTKPPPKVPFSIKPKFIPREAKAEKIAKFGLKRKKEDYPTMNDVVSDWDSKDEMLENNNGAKKNKNEIEAAKKNEEGELKHRKQEEAALENSQKKNGADEERKKQQPMMKPEDLLEKLRKDEEERVKKIRANKPMPKQIKRNTYEEKIAKGEVVRKQGEYPTFGDVVSDWESVDQKLPPSPKDKKPKDQK